MEKNAALKLADELDSLAKVPASTDSAVELYNSLRKEAMANANGEFVSDFFSRFLNQVNEGLDV